MLSVTFAFVVATALLLLSAATRALGVVAVFVLLCLEPLAVTAALAVAGVSYLLFFRRPKYEVLPKGASRPARRSYLPLAALLILLTLVGLPLVDTRPTGPAVTPAPAVRSEPAEEVIVLRTSGGLLEVSRIEVTEVLDARFEHTLLGLEVGETVPRIRVPAVYRYHVALDPQWKVVRREGVFTVVAPPVRPTLPVAVDFAGMEKDVGGSWILQPITGREDLDDLERSITAKLAQKASSRDYLSRQSGDARATIREFVRKWLVQQTPYLDAEAADVAVYFADEPMGSIEPLSG